MSLAVKVLVEKRANDFDSEESSSEENSDSSGTESLDNSSRAASSSEDSSSANPSRQNDDDGPMVYLQYGLLGFNADQADSLVGKDEWTPHNTNAPSSAFICESRGSGESYAMACMLENCLVPDEDQGVPGKRLRGLIFHYDVGWGQHHSRGRLTMLPWSGSEGLCHDQQLLTARTRIPRSSRSLCRECHGHSTSLQGQPHDHEADHSSNGLQ
jgi:hypothetical protein